jgi:hypothetical protein
VLLHVVREQSASAGNWQMVVLLVFTQFCPVGQSIDAWQASWHLRSVHSSDELQSLLRMHVPPTSIFFDELQPTRSHDETIVKPRRRFADISILQSCFRYAKALPWSRYGSGPVRFSQARASRCIHVSHLL